MRFGDKYINQKSIQRDTHKWESIINNLGGVTHTKRNELLMEEGRIA